MKDMDKMMSDKINHPIYYNSGKIETIDIISDQGWTEGFCLGNAIKYITRAGKKNAFTKIEDLEKAKWYLSYYIDFLKNEDTMIIDFNDEDKTD